MGRPGCEVANRCLSARAVGVESTRFVRVVVDRDVEYLDTWLRDRWFLMCDGVAR